MAVLKQEKILCHKEPIATIESFVRARKITLINPKSSYHKHTASLRITGEKFTLKIDTKQNLFSQELGSHNKALFVSTKPMPIVLDNIFINLQQVHLHTGTVQEIRSKRFQAKRAYYYRLLIPLKREINLFYCLENYIYSSDLGYRSTAATIIDTGKEKMAVCIVNDDKKKYYLSIESNIKQCFEDFSVKIFSIKCGLAFLTGEFSGGIHFYFAYPKAEMKKFTQLKAIESRKSFGSIYQPVHNNAYALPASSFATRKKWHVSKKLVKVNHLQFSKLYEKLRTYHEFTVAVLLIVQSMAASMEQLPGGIAIALEMLPAIISNDLKLPLTVIRDPAIEKKLITDMEKVIDTYAGILDEPTRRTLKNKLNSFNQPTNQNKLKIPFEQLGIPLSKNDLLAIDSRNSFLHGKIPDILKLGSDRSTIRKTKDAYYCGVRLYTLISILILKWIGFDGYVLNLPVIHKHITEVPLDEEPYRKV